MQYVVILYLWLSILLYLCLGGADFGAGIVELVTSKKNRSATRKTLHHAIGPIWEANHMWLIIAIVILFVGFPVIYSAISIYLHIPLLIMLMGIIARGTAFAFRNYDAVKDELQWWYTRIYVLSSFITPLFLGVPRVEVIPILLPIILPFNLIKCVINCSIAFFVYKPVSRLINNRDKK